MLVAFFLLFLEVHSKCSDRSIITCLKENNCLIVNNQCQSQQVNCYELNMTNCLESQCYYNQQQQICEFQNLNQKIHHRILNKKHNGQKMNRKTIRQKMTEEIENNTFPESNLDSDQNNPNPNENYDILNTNLEEQKIDYSKQDTIIFEISIEDLEQEYNEEDILSQKDESDYNFYTSSSINIIIIPIMILQLYI